jgi:ribulokinase
MIRSSILAGVGTGIFKDFSIGKEKAEFIDRMDPISANHDRYMEYHQLYRRLYSHIQEDFVTHARLREQHQRQVGG